MLRTVDTSSEIGDVALFERLRRGDETAIRELVERLEGDGAGYWWQAGRYLWSDQLTECLDRALGLLANEAPGSESEMSEDLWILPELLMELPLATAERLVRKHWAGLSRLADYVQVALYFASPGLRNQVREVVERCEDPASLFERLAHRFGVHVEGRRGITRLSQMKALLPYLDHLSDLDIRWLWEACNENSWFDWRRRHLDWRAKRAGGRFVDATSAMKELDKELARSEPFPWVDRWGEALLKTGFTRDDMMELVEDWLGSHGEEQALHMAVDLVTRFGRRRHLPVLQGHESAQSGRGQPIIDNASFGLQLRSLE